MYLPTRATNWRLLAGVLLKRNRNDMMSCNIIMNPYSYNTSCTCKLIMGE